MKKLMVMLVSAMALAMFGCEKNDCEKAIDIVRDAMAEVCKNGANATCSVCTCYNKGGLFEDGDCLSGSELEQAKKCDDKDEQEFAKSCVDNEAACRNGETETMKYVCGLEK